MNPSQFKFIKQRGGIANQAYQDEKLGEAAREAKQGWMRLSARWKSQNKRSLNNRQSQNQRQEMVENRPNLKGGVFSILKKSGSRSSVGKNDLEIFRTR
ncbi:hypothetical protein HAX54_013832 [Datura stramonium]|uniref:Uncharacterized protein n=1 Tax=Datura stramonium TaxID=4076 RepID=A0ABS8TNQ9_DATST|nr:hypothetical protein [Datura stramonium]